MTKKTKIVIFNETHQDLVMVMTGTYEIDSWDELILEMMEMDSEIGVDGIYERLINHPHFKDINHEDSNYDWYQDLYDRMKGDLESRKIKASEILTYLEDKTNHKYPLTFILDPNESVLRLFDRFGLKPNYWLP